MKAVVVGSGGWGTALSIVLCDNGHDVTLWSHNPAKAAEMERTRENPLLKGVHLPDALHITGDLECLRGADLVVSAAPSFAVRETGRKIAPYLTEKTVLVSVSKGIERDTNLRLSQVLRQETHNICQVVALSGPSHAEEVGIRMPTGCVSACADRDAARFVQDAFMNQYFRIYTSYDIIGVELAAALKNVVALACGVITGLGYQDNTKALLMTRAMAEITRLGEKLGGTRLTFGGLAGMGDLIVTCTSMHSRNNRAGILIGQGKTVQEAMEEVGAVVEGYYAAESIHPSARASTRSSIRAKPCGTWSPSSWAGPRRTSCWSAAGCKRPSDTAKERGSAPALFSRRVQLSFAVSRSSTRRAKASMEQSSTVSPGSITRSKKQLGISCLRSSFSMHREQPWSWLAGWHRQAVLRQGQK